jgi:hypothetical protein
VPIGGRNIGSVVAREPELDRELSGGRLRIAIIAKPLIVAMVTVFPDPPLGFATATYRRPHHLFEFLPEGRLVASHLTLDTSPEELLAGLTRTVGGLVDLTEEVVGEFDLDPHHFLSVDRGIC